MAAHSGELKRALRTVDVFAISAGAMISSGLFVLPAVVYAKSGPAILLAYLLASIFILPSLFSKAELTTAMPKSGGVYFFITRGFGSLFGTFSGLASWFSLSLKSSFALLGIGIFLQAVIPSVTPEAVKLIAVLCTLIFTVLNIFSVKESGKFQVIFVFILLGLIGFYVITGISHLDLNHFIPFNPNGWGSVFTVTGLIFVSYGGLTKVASIAEEVKDPSRSIPRGMFAAYGIVSLCYLLVIFVTVGLLSGGEIISSLLPISTGASKHTGFIGFFVLGVAAMLAFISTANAGLLAASRSPLAMARDQLLPPIVGRTNKKLQTPIPSIIITSVFMITCIVFLDLEQLVKVASTMKLLLFTFVNMTVIIMRQSKLVSYKPSFKSPLYPYLQIAGIVIYIFLIIEMGTLPLVLTLGFFLISLIWYLIYVRKKDTGKSAFIHMVENLANKEIVQDERELEGELIGILRERDEIKEDRFDSIIRNAIVMDMQETVTRDEFFKLLSKTVGERWNIPPDKVEVKLNDREAQASTLIYPGVAVPHAIPHIIIEGENMFDIVLVRNKFGIVWNEENEIVYTAFSLIGSKDERNFHLKALMSIAQILQDPDFHKDWMNAKSENELRSVILVTKRRRT
jgi:basic amino acid/polyamine antiporter, APA family